MSEGKKQTFHVEGMHCASCVVFIEDVLPGKHGVESVRVDLKSCTAEVCGDFTGSAQEVAELLTPLIAENGYRLHVEQKDIPSLEDQKAKSEKTKKEFFIAIPAALGFILAFVLLQEFNLVSIVGSGAMTYGTALLLGGIASVSTCLAVVGGLVLSLSANSAKNQGRWQSQALFHAGRLGGFFVLGGVIGVLGMFFQLGNTGTALLGIAVALIMLALGINLLDVFSHTSRFIPKMPKILAQQANRAKTSTHVLAPLFMGIATFFLPCGFTQSMQFYTLTTGSFVTGAFTMFFFALGTLPVLAALSFGAFEISHKPWKGIFFKAAGIIVIMLALFNIWNAFNLFAF